MKLISKNIILTIVLLTKNIQLYFCQSLDILSSPKLMKYNLCSFNNVVNVTTNEIKCECFYGFVRDNNIRKINNYDVDCSYQLKSRLITFTLSLIIPLGFYYFYLGYSIFFFLIFFIVIGIIIINLLLLKYVLKYDRLTSVGNIDKNFEKLYIKFKYIVIILDFIFLLLYVINAILQGTGVIKDNNGFYTINDFSLE